LGLHCYAVSTLPDELVFEPPPKKNPGSAYATVHKKKLSTAIFILCMDMI